MKDVSQNKLNKVTPDLHVYPCAKQLSCLRRRMWFKRVQPFISLMGFWPPWPMSEAKSGDICESYCKIGALIGLPNFFVVVICLFWMLVLMMCCFFPSKRSNFKTCQQKTPAFLFSHITMCQMVLSDSMKRWYCSWISLSLTPWKFHIVPGLNLDFQTACAVLRRHPLFEICKESQQTSRTWELFILPEESRKRHQEPPCANQGSQRKEAFHMVDDEKTSSQSQWCKNKTPSKSLGEYKNHTLHASEMEPTSW